MSQLLEQLSSLVYKINAAEVRQLLEYLRIQGIHCGFRALGKDEKVEVDMEDNAAALRLFLETLIDKYKITDMVIMETIDQNPTTSQPCIQVYMVPQDKLTVLTVLKK